MLTERRNLLGAIGSWAGSRSVDWYVNRELEDTGSANPLEFEEIEQAGPASWAFLAPSYLREQRWRIDHGLAFPGQGGGR